MLIDNTTYKLPVKNFVPVAHKKSKIVLGHTFNTNMKHFNGWLERENKEFKKTAAFTVDINGKIYQHFEPQYYSYLLDDDVLNEESIIILLENEGWLEQAEDKNKFINWAGHIYNRRAKPVCKLWRKHKFWAPYPNKQVLNATELVKSLCYDFRIPREVQVHNVKMDLLDDYDGILYKSNIDKLVTDVSPAWDCISFKENLEIKIKTKT